MVLRVSLAVLFAWASLAPGVCAVACGDAPAQSHAAAPAEAMPCHGEQASPSSGEPARPSECCDGEHAFQAFAKFSAPELGTVVATIELQTASAPIPLRASPNVRPLRVLHSPYLQLNPPLLI